MGFVRLLLLITTFLCVLGLWPFVPGFGQVVLAVIGVPVGLELAWRAWKGGNGLFRLRRARHPILQPGPLDGEMAQLPPPPTDLPKPWNGARWRLAFCLGFAATYLALLWIGRRLGDPVPSAGAFAISGFAFTFLWLILGGFVWHMRGYWVNYSRWGNPAVAAAIKRYRRTNLIETRSPPYPRYVIEGKTYYLAWYTPVATKGPQREVVAGKEPLLLDEQGRWIDDEALFEKALLMWFWALNIAPGAWTNGLIQGYNGLLGLVLRFIPELPRLLKANSSRYVRRGLEQEWTRVMEGYEAHCAYFRDTLDGLKKKAQWGEAYGWDSLVELRYEHILPAQAKRMEAINTRREFQLRHRLDETREAAASLRRAVAGRWGFLRGWKDRRKLDGGLQILAIPIIIGDEELPELYKEAPPKAPDVILRAYRSRVAYAREVEAKLGASWAAAEGR